MEGVGERLICSQKPPWHEEEASQCFSCFEQITHPGYLSPSITLSTVDVEALI